MLRLLTLILVMTSSAFADDADDPFQRGLTAYQRRDFAGARDRFREAIERGPVTARLLHNLALAHYQLNQRAFALAYWRKALAVEPSYPAALTGRELLENHMHMRPFERDGLDLLVRQRLERVSGFLVSWVLAVLITVFAWSLLRHLGERRAARDEERPTPSLPIATASVGVLMLATAALLGLKLSYGRHPRATVVADAAHAKSLPNDESATLFELSPGGEVLVKRRADGWTQVQTNDGGTGWVKDADVVVTSDM